MEKPVACDARLDPAPVGRAPGARDPRKRAPTSEHAADEHAGVVAAHDRLDENVVRGAG
jgi:hypothetical protein